MSDEVLNKEISMLPIISSAMIRLMSNFIEIKNKQFKISKFVVHALSETQKYFELFKTFINPANLSLHLEEINKHITEFNEILITDNHLI